MLWLLVTTPHFFSLHYHLHIVDKYKKAMKQQAPTSKKATAAKQTSAAKAAAKASPGKRHKKQSGTSEERKRLIAEAAYLIAEQRGFQGDMALNDWLQVEAEVDARFAARH